MKEGFPLDSLSIDIKSGKYFVYITAAMPICIRALKNSHILPGCGAVKKLYKSRVTPKLSICFGIRWLYYGQIKRETGGAGNGMALLVMMSTNGQNEMRGWDAPHFVQILLE